MASKRISGVHPTRRNRLGCRSEKPRDDFYYAGNCLERLIWLRPPSSERKNNRLQPGSAADSWVSAELVKSVETIDIQVAWSSYFLKPVADIETLNALTGREWGRGITLPSRPGGSEDVVAPPAGSRTEPRPKAKMIVVHFVPESPPLVSRIYISSTLLA